jgi:hypothetical protein
MSHVVIGPRHTLHESLMIDLRKLTGQMAMLLALIASVGACATENPPLASPAKSQHAQVHVGIYQPSKLDLPPGAYLVPDTQFVVFNMNKSVGTGFAALFGPLGVITATDSGRASASAMVPKGNFHLLDLSALATKQLTEELASNGRYSNLTAGKGDKAGYLYLLLPRAWVTTDKKDRVHVTVSIGVELLGPDGAKTWKNDFVGFSSVGERVLTGDEGWLSQGGDLLNAAAKRGIERAMLDFLNSAATN